MKFDDIDIILSNCLYENILWEYVESNRTWSFYWTLTIIIFILVPLVEPPSIGARIVNL